MTSPLSGFEGMAGGEWQVLCIRVLHEHHGGGNLIEIPDDDRGDHGIEAFSLDGTVYQCYSPAGEPLSGAERLRKQRRKMNDSCTDFIGNAAKIEALLPEGLKIVRHVLLMPHITSKELVALAAKLTKVIRDEGLSITDGEFCIVPTTLRAYEGAMYEVVNRQLRKLDLPPLSEPDYSGIADPQVEVMHTKLAKTAAYSDDGARGRFVTRLLENHVSGLSYREFVHDQFSELAQELDEQLVDLEDRLGVQYPLSHTDPDGLLGTVLRDTETTVADVLNTRNSHSRVMAEGQIADWLMRCPLDFR